MPSPGYGIGNLRAKMLKVKQSEIHHNEGYRGINMFTAKSEVFLFLILTSLLIGCSGKSKTERIVETNALVGAACRGEVDSVRHMIQRGTNIDALDSEGMSALIGASITGRTEVVNTLIHAGCDLDTRVSLSKFQKGYNALAFAVANGHRDIVETLLAAGASVNSKSSDGYTLLMIAAAGERFRSSLGSQCALWGDPVTLKILIKNGANIDVKDDKGYSALAYAVMYCIPDNMETLLKAGADPSRSLIRGDAFASDPNCKAGLYILNRLLNTRYDSGQSNVSDQLTVADSLYRLLCASAKDEDNQMWDTCLYRQPDNGEISFFRDLLSLQAFPVMLSISSIDENALLLKGIYQHRRDYAPYYIMWTLTFHLVDGRYLFDVCETTFRTISRADFINEIGAVIQE